METKFKKARLLARKHNRTVVIATYDYGNGDGPMMGIFWESDLDNPELSCFDPIVRAIINEDGSIQ